MNLRPSTQNFAIVARGSVNIFRDNKLRIVFIEERTPSLIDCLNTSLSIPAKTRDTFALSCRDKNAIPWAVRSSPILLPTRIRN